MVEQGAPPYGQAAGDTDFRKKYDLEEYAEKAKKREGQTKRPSEKPATRPN